MHKSGIVVVLSLLLGGCGLAPPLAPSEPPSLPQNWQGESAGDAVTADWWQGFASEELNALVARARRESLDVAQAAARVEQAAARLKVAGAARVPEIGASLTRSQSGAVDGGAPGSKSFGLGLEASYELDLWGRVGALEQSALAAWQASRFERDAVRLSITAATVNTWLQSVSRRERLQLARDNLALARRLLQLVEARHGAGAATALEVAQQRGLVATQERLVAALGQEAEESRSLLAILLGSTAGIPTEQDSLQDIQVPGVAVGLPGELLTRRPDIAEAEARLQGARADIQAARAALLPKATLELGLGGDGGQWSRLLEHPLYSLAAALTAPIFNGGRLAAQRDLTVARREELLAAYRQTIVTACAEVETALSRSTGLAQQSRAMTAELSQAGRAVNLAEARYQAGAATLMTLLETQRTYYQTRDLALQLHLARLQSAVALFKALGGGWQAVGVDPG